MDGEYWYKYIKEHKPDVLGKDIIDYVEQLKLDKEALEKQLILSGVSSMLILTPKDAEVFFNEIMNPKEANKALKKAMLKFITR
jgi:hypothetical protein